jgi:ketosteroid isomerase-like protein
MVLLSFGSSALVEPKAEVAAATLAWGQALGEDDPEKVLPFYSDDAVLWGTLSPSVRSDRAALRDYFVTAFKVLPGLKVAFGVQLIRVYGNAAVNTGYYTFSYVKMTRRRACPRDVDQRSDRSGEPGYVDQRRAGRRNLVRLTITRLPFPRICTWKTPLIL